MNFGFSAEQERLRQEVEAFCRENLTEELRERYGGTLGEPHAPEFYRKLAERGYLGLGWPREYGGGGGDRVDVAILRSILDNSEAPMGGYGPTVGLVAQSLLAHGSEAQKREFLPRMARGEILCCMAITEPNAGSDAAALQLRAKEDGGDYLLRGRKLYITGAQWADYVLTIARTNPQAPKHLGASLFLVGARLPGLTVRPLPTMGQGAVNEVIYEDVRVPAAMLVGQKDQGWKHLRQSLAMERVSLGGVRNLPRLFEELVQYCRETKRDGQVLFASESVRRTLAELKIRIRIAQLLYWQAAWRQAQGEDFELQASFSKQFTSELYQRFADRALEILGRHGQAQRGDRYAVLKGSVELWYRHCVFATIGGGTTQIQRNLQAQRGLGLPR
jgi:alkylation response protein AidB-like acyl-CoA dehydrogenase